MFIFVCQKLISRILAPYFESMDTQQYQNRSLEDAVWSEVPPKMIVYLSDMVPPQLAKCKGQH
jgi:hypothetical protein